MIQISSPVPRYLPGSDGRFYFLHKEKRTWKEAKSICQSEMVGATLAIVDQEETADVVKKIFKKVGKNIWLGGTDAGTEGEWRWIPPLSTVVQNSQELGGKSWATRKSVC